MSRAEYILVQERHHDAPVAIMSSMSLNSNDTQELSIDVARPQSLAHSWSGWWVGGSHTERRVKD